jgi:hypothetical protein
METKQIKTLADRLLAAQREIGTIQKDGTNPHFKSKYATLPQIIGEVKPILNRHDLLLTQPIRGNKVISEISYLDDCIGSEIELPQNLNAQQLGSAITYFRRYTLASLLALEIEDDDGNQASVQTDNRPWLNENTPVFKEAVKFLKENGSISDIEKKYKLSEKAREKLLSEAI